MRLIENLSMEEKILEAAFDVIDRKTISGTRMHLIADAAQMPQPNLHYYFKTKKDLLLALLKYIQKDFYTMRIKALNDKPDTIEKKISGFFEQKKHLILNNSKYDRVQVDFWNMGQIDEEINKSIQKSYSDWRNHIVLTFCQYDPGTNIEKINIVASVMISMMMGATLQYLNDDNVFDLDDYFSTCVKMITGYIED